MFTNKRLRIFYFFFALILFTSLSFAENFIGYWKIMPITFSGYTNTETLNNFPALIILEETEAGVGFSYSDFLSPPY
ncbi:MAG: hypothetical protein GX811_13290, partial [Lentisphaerae bacterium]|nr:hypothetical protein [Lentisphaerota bacterium]